MKWYLYVIISVLALILGAGIERIIDFFLSRRAKNAEWQKERQLPVISEEEKIALLKYNGLEREIAILLRLYYSENGCKRILFYRHKEHITVFRERLTLFNEEELCYSDCYGVWTDDGDGFYHIYDDEETAWKEWEKELSAYREEPLPAD